MKTKRFLILLLLVVFSFGCASHKDESNTAVEPTKKETISRADSQSSGSEIDIQDLSKHVTKEAPTPKQEEDRVEVETIEEPYYAPPFPLVEKIKKPVYDSSNHDFFREMLGLDLGVKTTPQRLGLGMAFLTSGALVYAANKKLDIFFSNFYTILKSVAPGGTHFVSTKHITYFRNSIRFLMNRLKLSKGASVSIAKRLLLTKPGLTAAASLSTRRGTTWTARLLSRGGRILGGSLFMLGVLEIVLDPTMLAVGELTQQDHFKSLEYAIDDFENHPHDYYKQGSVIEQTFNYLPFVINNLRAMWNERYEEWYLVESNKEKFSATEVQEAKEEFEAWEKKRVAEIAYYQAANETLRDIYYVDNIDRAEAKDKLLKTKEKIAELFENPDFY